MIVDIVLAVLIVLVSAFYVREVRMNYMAGLHSKFEATAWGMLFVFFGSLGISGLIIIGVSA